MGCLGIVLIAMRHIAVAESYEKKRAVLNNDGSTEQGNYSFNINYYLDLAIGE